MRSGLCLLVAVVLAGGGGVLAGSARADATDRAVAYQVNVAHSGVQTDNALAPGFSRRWRTTLPALVSYPLIAQGMVFVTAGDNASATATLYALDQQTGQVVWSQPLAFFRPWANAAYEGGRIFVVGNNPVCCGSGLMSAFAADTGAPLWTAQLPGQYLFSSPPTAANGLVYTAGAGSGGTVYAVDEASGAVVATQPVANGDHSSPALSDSGVFVSYACNQAFGFSQTPPLAFLWHYSTGCEGGGGKTVVYANGHVYTRDFSGDLVLDAGTGNLLGSFTSVYAPAVDQTSIFTASPGLLSAQNLADGSTSWTFTGDGQLDTAPIVLATAAGEFVVEGSATGMLYALNAASGTAVWSTSVGAAIPQPDEQNLSQPLTGLAAGQGLLVVPAGNTVSAYASDSTPPTITVPSTITAAAMSSSGAIVSYSVSATDPDDTATVGCTPSSGSTFPVGATTVRCTATDTAGNQASASFLVVVSAQGAGCYLPGASLSAANATNVNLTGTYLDSANLSSANLSQAHMERTVLSHANLSGVKLNFADLAGASLAGANLTSVSWLQTTCPDGTNSNNDGGTCTGHLG